MGTRDNRTDGASGLRFCVRPTYTERMPRMTDMRAAYRKMAEEAAEGLARLDAIPNLTEFPIGTVLLYRVAYPDSYVDNRRGGVYTYVSIVVETATRGRVWYTTGNTMRPHGDHGLTNFLVSNDIREISIVTGWEILYGDVQD